MSAQQMTKGQAVIAVLAVVAVGALTAQLLDDDRPASHDPPPPQAAKPSPPRTTISDFEAWDGAREMVRQRLKAPTQAKFSGEQILAREGWRALVLLSVDAPNSFGVMLRSRLCVAVFLDGEEYRWNKITAISECSDAPTDDEIKQMELLSLWPLATRRASGMPER